MVVRIAAGVLLVAFASSALAQEFRSTAYCAQLAEIGANAYRAKKDGHSMESVLQKTGYILADDAQRKKAAQGAVIAIYGDGSIKSPKQAYDIVYSACKG